MGKTSASCLCSEFICERRHSGGSDENAAASSIDASKDAGVPRAIHLTCTFPEAPKLPGRLFSPISFHRISQCCFVKKGT
jgi:hypothetical protein